MINIGLIGIGNSAIKIHLPALIKIKELKVNSIFDINFKNLKAIKEKYNILNLHYNYKDFFSDPKIDAVLITSPNSEHYKHIIQALKNGKHVICEKPFVLKTGQILKIKKLALQKKLVCTCFLMQRFRAPTVFLKDKIDNDFFGSIYHADLNILFKKSDTVNKDLFVNRSHLGSGLIYDIGSHFIDLAWFLMRSPKPKTLYVTGSNNLVKFYKKNHLPINSNFNINDFVVGLVKFENGSSLSFKFSYITNIKNNKKKIKFYTEKGYFEWPKLKINILKNNQNISLKVSVVEKTKASIMHLKHFIKAIKGEDSNIATLDEILTLTLIIESLNKSEYKNKLIKL